MKLKVCILNINQQTIEIECIYEIKEEGEGKDQNFGFEKKQVEWINKRKTKCGEVKRGEITNDLGENIKLNDDIHTADSNTG